MSLAAAWQEYDGAAEWCARRGLKGAVGDPLPPMLSVVAKALIDEDPEAFGERVRATAYALAMEKHETPLCPACVRGIGGAFAGPDAPWRLKAPGESCGAADCLTRGAHRCLDSGLTTEEESWGPEGDADEEDDGAPAPKHDADLTDGHDEAARMGWDLPWDEVES